jgi:CrcB protein
MSIVAYAGAKMVITPGVRIVLTTGFMGGLTTYSAYNWETIVLARDGSWTLGACNAALTFVACLASGLGGLAIAHAVFDG